jgi:hypothetical protein
MIVFIIYVGEYDWVLCWKSFVEWVLDGLFPTKSVGVCRGVLRVSDPRIQDSRTDFPPFSGILVDSTSTRGWCKMEDSSGDS